MIKKRAFSVFYMFILTLVFTAAVTGIYGVNKKRISLNEKIKLDKIILKVLDIKLDPSMDDEAVIELFMKRVEKKEERELLYYRGLSENGKETIGYVIPLQGSGLWGPIYGMMGVDRELQKVLGVAFYEHSETPGLGGRITEPWFVDQFKGRALKPLGEKKMYFSFRPDGKAAAPNEVDAVTGATLTSKGVERFMNANLHFYLPRIAQEESLPGEVKK